jgi:glucosamine--fructose-6-phosphate aminotransferase (isomerizing)
MRAEIDSIPSMLRREAARWHDEAEAVVAAAAGRRQWMTVGRGSSGNAATLFSYLHTLRTGRAVADVRPSAQGSAAPGTYDDAVLLAYSASGRATDVSAVTRAVGEAGGLTVAIENAGDASGLLVEAASHWITLGAGLEKAVPATRSYVAQLVVSAALAGVDVRSGAEALADGLESLGASGVPERLAEHLDPARVCVWLARGPALAGADDAALKLSETAQRPGVSWSTAEVRHGPVAAMDSRDRAIAFLDTDAHEGTVRDAAKALSGRGVPTLVLAPANVAGGDVVLPFDVSEPWVAAVALAVVSQRVALAMAETAGLDPDAPPGLAKVTQTY